MCTHFEWAPGQKHCVGENVDLFSWPLIQANTCLRPVLTLTEWLSECKLL